ncbi:carbonic anhydrase [Halapricum hydrolyticum]|uniref:carbonic anhydrase n=1 Tax=Halapricum hydrolyticum TaxID=2979991 RepID=A0AAE3IBY0_9EURY|nr:carbonic anhydrase [Halapricum hydrolyticum]MCU4717986.1 IcfA [Halapricum hydrolyticum]MCU4727151.1 IcfA [Halapricum hydrolyticum]
MDQTVFELLERNREHAETFDTRFDDVQDGQRPDAVTVCCSDSRVLQDQMWGNERPGQLFTCANIGNRVIQQTADGEVVSGDVLYPIAHTGTEVAIVVGHTGCGAVTATYDHLIDGLSEPPGIEHSIGLLAPHLRDGVETLPDGLDRDEAINRLVEYNVDRQVEVLRESDDVPDSVTIVGVVYDFQDIYEGRRGEVHVVNIDGTRSVEALRTDYPDIEDRIDRLWEYEP